MAKAIFGEYGAYTTPGGIRFQKNNKLISEKAIPPEAAAYLRKSLGENQAQIVPPPTEEQKAKLRAESLQVPPELQRTPEEMAEATPLTEEDFPDMPKPDTIEQAQAPVTDEIIEEVASGTYGTETIVDGDEVIEAPIVDTDFLEQVSIHTASIEDIAEALYARFGIYTVWLKRQPVADEINPLTGAMFTKYHLGIAYQAAIFAQNRGLLELDPAVNRKVIDQNRAASANFKEQFEPQAVSIRENRQADTFDWRTSPVGTRDVATTEIVHEKGTDGQVHAVQRTINGEPSETGLKNGAGVKYDRDEDEPLVQPNFSGKPIIRPDW